MIKHVEHFNGTQNTQTQSQVIKNKVVINFKKKGWTIFHYLTWQKIMSL